MEWRTTQMGFGLVFAVMLGACTPTTPPAQPTPPVSGDERATQHAVPALAEHARVEADVAPPPAPAPPTPPAPAVVAPSGTDADAAVHHGASGHSHHAEGHGHGGGGALPPGPITEMQVVMRPLAHGAATPNLATRVCTQARALREHAAAIEAGPIPEAMRARADAWRASTARVSRAAVALAAACERGPRGSVTERLDALHTAFHGLTDDL